jgi:6-phosphofructokinase 1
MRMVVVTEAAAGGSTKVGNVTGRLRRGQTRRVTRRRGAPPPSPPPPAVRYSSAMSKNSVRNAFYAQSGGVSAVINASACGVIETALRSRRIGKVYAGRDGIIGALTEDLIDVGRESRATIRALKYTPAGAFGSARFKLKGIDQNRAEYERLIEVFRAHDIGYFFYNGGNDSMDTALKVSQLGAALGFPITCVGVPKTVDNDLPHTDCCPGFGSVAKYVAVSTREAALDVASMARTSTRVFVLEVMGRHAGWIAAASGLAGKSPAEAPHIILFPEVPFEQQRFLAQVHAAVESHGYCVIVVSEGAAYADGKFLADAGTRDAFGHTQLGGVAPVVANMVREAHGYKYHWAVADYLQRAARHIASKVDVEQAYAVGRAAVQLALQGVNAVMPIIVRRAQRPYRWSIGHVPLAEVANKEKKLPREYIREDGFGITAACRRYLEPLIAGEAYPPYRDGLPDYVRIKGVPVRRKLKDEFKL